MDKSKFQNKKEWRKFGIGLAVILVLIVTVQFFLAEHVNYYLLGVGAIVFLSAITFPILLKPIFILFSYFAFVLGWINTRVILFLIFYLLFFPLTFILKAFGHETLNLKIDKNKESYWEKRPLTESKKESYENQF